MKERIYALPRDSCYLIRHCTEVQTVPIAIHGLPVVAVYLQLHCLWWELRVISLFLGQAVTLKPPGAKLGLLYGFCSMEITDHPPYM